MDSFVNYSYLFFQLIVSSFFAILFYLKGAKAYNNCFLVRFSADHKEIKGIIKRCNLVHVGRGRSFAPVIEYEYEDYIYENQESFYLSDTYKENVNVNICLRPSISNNIVIIKKDGFDIIPFMFIIYFLTSIVSYCAVIVAIVCLIEGLDIYN